MLFQSTFSLATILLVTSLQAFARVTNMYAPSTATGGQNISVVLENHPYISNWDDFGVVWGLRSGSQTCDTCIGMDIGYETLYGNPGYDLGNNTFQVAIPDFDQGGEFTFTAAIPFLVGAGGTLNFHNFTQAMTITAGST